MKNTNKLLNVTIASALAAGCVDDLTANQNNESDMYNVRDSSVFIHPRNTIPVTDAYVTDCSVGAQRVIEDNCKDNGIQYQNCEEYFLDDKINEPIRDWGFEGVRGDKSPCHFVDVYEWDSTVAGNNGSDAGVDYSDTSMNDSGLIAGDYGVIFDSNLSNQVVDSTVLPDVGIDASIMDCLDGDLEEQCCGILERQERSCEDGIWGDWGDCEAIDPAELDFVNVSNNGLQDNSPSLSGDRVAFVSGRVINLVNLSENQPIPRLVSGNIPTPGVSGDFWSGSDWYSSPDRCYTPTLSADRLAFVCDWTERDVWFDDSYYGFLYLGRLNQQDILQNIVLPLYTGYNPSLSERAFAYDWGNVQINDLVNGGGFVEAGRLPNAKGDYVVFESSRNNFPTGKEIYQRDLSDGNPAINISQSRDIDDNKPTISEEGIAVWYSNIPLTGPRVMLYNPQDGLQARRLTNNNFDERNPVIDGSLVVFEGGRQGSTDLYVVDRETGVQLNLTDSPQNNNNYQPSLSEGRLAFTSNRTGDEEIFVVDLLGNRCREE